MRKGIIRSNPPSPDDREVKLQYIDFLQEFQNREIRDKSSPEFREWLSARVFRCVSALDGYSGSVY
jgi:hypothetical protein